MLTFLIYLSHALAVTTSCKIVYQLCQNSIVSMTGMTRYENRRGGEDGGTAAKSAHQIPLVSAASGEHSLLKPVKRGAGHFAPVRFPDDLIEAIQHQSEGSSSEAA
jgi:hypothetical protein